MSGKPREGTLLLLQHLYFYKDQSLENRELRQNPSFLGSLDPVPISDPCWLLFLTLVEELAFSRVTWMVGWSGRPYSFPSPGFAGVQPAGGPLGLSAQEPGAQTSFSPFGASIFLSSGLLTKHQPHPFLEGAVQPSLQIILRILEGSFLRSLRPRW